MIIDVPVQIGVEAAELPSPIQPIAAECPGCFAIVRTARLADHQQAAHGDGEDSEG